MGASTIKNTLIPGKDFYRYMSNPNRSSGCLKTVRKFFLSAFVVITFIAYALEKKIASIPVTGEEGSTVLVPTTGAPSATVGNTAPSSGYKDGTYTGSSVYINWGYIQVQAMVSGGRLSAVKFLEYPNERRTSVRINSVAIPDLQQEAIQAQSANVDIVTGATLTSEGFEQSLQSALDQAKS
jgi:uncharacterized protein with FMN-binding domain